MGQPFHRRGHRTDEMLKVMRDSWQPARIPVLVGGQTDIALRRAVLNDGWVGSFSTTTEQAIDLAGRLRAMRAESGMAVDDFTILKPHWWMPADTATTNESRPQGSPTCWQGRGVPAPALPKWWTGCGSCAPTEVVSSARVARR
jgi:hypothetical protein